MNLGFSLYLDVVRFTAAVAVLMSHISFSPFTENVVWRPIGLYGDAAVSLFFVLSGYVIAYVTDKSEKDFKSYTIARISRLYSVILIALPLTFMLDATGKFINPEFYNLQKVLWKPESIEGYVASFFLINEWQFFDFNGLVPGSNGPYWSLSFEATYYIAIGIALFMPRKFSWILILILLFLAGRTIAAMFPLWLLGFAIYKYNIKIQTNKFISLLLVVISILLLVVSPILKQYGSLGFYFPWGRGPFARALVHDYWVAFAFALNLISVKSLLDFDFSLNSGLVKIVRWLGALTFPLYCFHYPILCFFAAISFWNTSTVFAFIFESIAAIIIVICLTPITNLLKSYIRNVLHARMRMQPR